MNANLPAPAIWGQSWPVLPPEMASKAAGLPRAVLVEAGETPPRPDPGDVDPLMPHTWRPLMRPTQAGAVALIPVPPGQGPAPVSLAARGLRLLGRLLASAAIIVALGCKGCA